MVEYYVLRYENGKMRPVETVLRMRGLGRQSRMMEGVNLTIMYCKHFCKCHNVALVQQ
jgi:hypothetical protein